MKKKSSYILTIIILFIVSVSVPTWLWIRDYVHQNENMIDSTIMADFASFQSLIISFWGLIINAILVIIAYKAFRNFDVKKQFHNKQLDIVSELATAINSTILSNMLFVNVPGPDGQDHQVATGFEFGFFTISLGFDYSKFDSIYVNSNNIENIFPFLIYRNHPLLPKSIANALIQMYKPLQYSLSTSKDKLPKSYALLYSDRINKDDMSKDWTYKIYQTPTDFTKDSLNLRKVIVDWYKEYGAEDLNI